MFVFGDPASNAELYLADIVKNTQGPPFSKLHPDEMTHQELKNALVWLWSAISRAHQSGVEEGVMDVLVEWYDEVFVALSSLDTELLELLRKTLHTPPRGVQDRAKYIELAEKASES